MSRPTHSITRPAGGTTSVHHALCFKNRMHYDSQSVPGEQIHHSGRICALTFFSHMAGAPLLVSVSSRTVFYNAGKNKSG